MAKTWTNQTYLTINAFINVHRWFSDTISRPILRFSGKLAFWVPNFTILITWEHSLFIIEHNKVKIFRLWLLGPLRNGCFGTWRHYNRTKSNFCWNKGRISFYIPSKCEIHLFFLSYLWGDTSARNFQWQKAISSHRTLNMWTILQFCRWLNTFPVKNRRIMGYFTLFWAILTIFNPMICFIWC